MKRDFNYVDKDWDVKDISEEVNSMAAEIISYFDEFDDDDGVCTIWLNDINNESQLENLSLIRNAPNMYRLLLQAESYLPPELLNEWLKIQKDLSIYVE